MKMKGMHDGTIIMAAFLTSMAVLWAPVPASGAYLPSESIEIPDIGDGLQGNPQFVDFPVPEKPKERNKDSRISQDLRDTQEDIEQLLAEAPDADLSVLSIPSFRQVTEDGYINVYTHVDDSKKHLMDKLEAFGLLVELTSEPMSLVQGWAPYDSLDRLSRVPGVSHLSLPGYALPTEISLNAELPEVGSVGAVPEPATLSLLVLGGLALFRRRK